MRSLRLSPSPAREKFDLATTTLLSLCRMAQSRVENGTLEREERFFQKGYRALARGQLGAARNWFRRDEKQTGVASDELLQVEYLLGGLRGYLTLERVVGKEQDNELARYLLAMHYVREALPPWPYDKAPSRPMQLRYLLEARRHFAQLLSSDAHSAEARKRIDDIEVEYERLADGLDLA